MLSSLISVISGGVSLIQLVLNGVGVTEDVTSGISTNLQESIGDLFSAVDNDWLDVLLYFVPVQTLLTITTAFLSFCVFYNVFLFVWPTVKSAFFR